VFVYASLCCLFFLSQVQLLTPDNSNPRQLEPRALTRAEIDFPLISFTQWYNGLLVVPRLPWVPETFLARFPVSVKYLYRPASPLVASPYGRRCVGLRPAPKIPAARECTISCTNFIKVFHVPYFTVSHRSTIGPSFRASFIP